MIRSITRLSWLGLLGIVWIGMTQQGQAWENPLVKVSSTRINFHMEFSTTPAVPRPTAPWYAYFPADPRMVQPMQATPYPPWPVQFPPPGPPADAFKGVQKQSGALNVPQGPMQTQHWPGYYTYGSNLQPVGYVPAQAPSYWYQGR